MVYLTYFHMKHKAGVKCLGTHDDRCFQVWHHLVLVDHTPPFILTLHIVILFSLSLLLSCIEIVLASLLQAFRLCIISYYHYHLPPFIPEKYHKYDAQNTVTYLATAFPN